MDCFGAKGFLDSTEGFLTLQTEELGGGKEEATPHHNTLTNCLKWNEFISLHEYGLQIYSCNRGDKENYSKTAIKLMMNAACVGKMTHSTKLLFTAPLPNHSYKKSFGGLTTLSNYGGIFSRNIYYFQLKWEKYHQ